MPYASIIRTLEAEKALYPEIKVREVAHQESYEAGKLRARRRVLVEVVQRLNEISPGDPAIMPLLEELAADGPDGTSRFIDADSYVLGVREETPRAYGFCIDLLRLQMSPVGGVA